MLHFAGIKRSSEFSPNHRGNDNAIFRLTIQELEKLDCRVDVYSEDDLIQMDCRRYQHVLTMSRNKQTVQRLQELEKEGKFVINSGFGIEKCFRTNMTIGLQENKIPYPKSLIIPTSKFANGQLKELGETNFWIKRGDFHAIHKEDVSFAHTPSQANDILKEYSLRGITEAVVSEHLYGDLVKFYGVRGTDFFYWFYPYEFNHSKYNAEAINGAAQYYDFDLELLKRYSNNAADALGVDIYGGDAIISLKGDIHLIDVNDWPSFAPCRDEASVYIARRIYEKAKTHVSVGSLQ